MNIATLFQSNTWYAVVVGAAVGSVAGYIGSLMVSKRMALMAGALGHLTLPGIALALLFGFDVSLGALLFLIIGIFFIWLLERATNVPVEALTAVVFTTAVAAAFLFLPQNETETALLGDISQITLPICIITLSVSALIFAITRFIFKRMVLITLSSDLAKAQNIPVSLYNFIYLSSIALIIALGVRIIGGLMTAALVAIPASTSRNISATLSGYAYTSFVIGGISCVIGIILSQLIHLPVGAMIILSSAFLFMCSLFFKTNII